MAIEKMKLVNIIGPLKDFERVVMNYVINREIHVENLFDVIGKDNKKTMKPFDVTNEYADAMRLINQTSAALGLETENIPSGSYNMPIDEVTEFWTDLSTKLGVIKEQTAALKEKISENNAIISQLENMKDSDVTLKELFSFKNIKIRFGKMPKEAFSKLETYISGYSTYFMKFSESRDYVYGAYFAPKVLREKIDSIFSSLYFQRLRIPESCQGLPSDEIKRLTAQNEESEKAIEKLNVEISKIVHNEYEKISYSYRSVKYHFEANEVKKLSGWLKHTFAIAGWVPEGYLADYQKLFEQEKNITLVVEEPDIVPTIKPPTKLKNPAVFRPFQSFVEMYGLPSYNEIDPTALFAITYTLMFGMMYGDLGHGFILAIVGLLLSKKKNFLGPILVCCSVSSMIFGAVFSSIFGYENLFWHGLWEPMKEMMPTLIATVVLGALVITAVMIMNIANGIKQKNPERVLFDPNGLAGIVFYWAVIIVALSALNLLPIKISAVIVVVFVAVPFLLMFLKEPLGRLLERRKDWLPEDKGGFILETFFESFELLLSYVTNTVSFIRVGAFALNHAGMMQVVFTLSRLFGGSGSIFVIIIGNIIVLALEGLLVAIQVLRLQFYEMFSRYYEGDGRPFKKIGGF